MVKSKVTAPQALRCLEKAFKPDLQSIYSEIGKFREGFKCMETYTGQQKTTMFSQIIYFLGLKDDIDNDAAVGFRSGQGVFPSLLGEEEI